MALLRREGSLRGSGRGTPQTAVPKDGPYRLRSWRSRTALRDLQTQLRAGSSAENDTKTFVLVSECGSLAMNGPAPEEFLTKLSQCKTGLCVQGTVRLD